MAENSKIEWTHHTFNPWIGCQKVGPGCDHCYAEAMMDTRLGRVDWGPHASRSRTSASYWRQPLKWNREAAAAGERRRVFCASLADVFDNHGSIQDEWRSDLWRLIEATPNLDWMLLTKRLGNIRNMLPVSFDFERLYQNVWLGCTVVNQAEADRDIHKLTSVPAVRHFLSFEPLLGEIVTDPCELIGIDLVIVGGESGPGSRPMHPDWARSLRDQCVATGVPFFFKQHGDWISVYDRDRDDPDWRAVPKPGDWDRKRWLNLAGGMGFHGDKLNMMRRVGKKASGRLLDGRTWDQMPGGRT